MNTEINILGHNICAIENRNWSDDLHWNEQEQVNNITNMTQSENSCCLITPLQLTIRGNITPQTMFLCVYVV